MALLISAAVVTIASSIANTAQRIFKSLSLSIFIWKTWQVIRIRKILSLYLNLRTARTAKSFLIWYTIFFERHSRGSCFRYSLFEPRVSCTLEGKTSVGRKNSSAVAINPNCKRVLLISARRVPRMILKSYLRASCRFSFSFLCILIQ